MPNDWQPSCRSNPSCRRWSGSPSAPRRSCSRRSADRWCAPPQSTSVSPWFLMPSVQLGGTQRPAVQTPECSRCRCGTPWRRRSGAQSAPPQSMSDSVPFRIVSVQLAATQTLAAQIRLTQSVVATQRLPLAHDEQVAPPQSMSVSSAFILTSVHEVQIPRRAPVVRTVGRGGADFAVGALAAGRGAAAVDVHLAAVLHPVDARGAEAPLAARVQAVGRDGTLLGVGAFGAGGSGAAAVDVHFTAVLHLVDARGAEAALSSARSGSRRRRDRSCRRRTWRTALRRSRRQPRRRS